MDRNNSLPKQNITIKDIARHAGVAISTVSYVINNTKEVKTETRGRIEEAIRELNYKPSMVARSLKTGRSKTIGVIVPGLSNNFFVEIVQGIEDVTYANDYTIILCSTMNNAEKEKRYLSTLLQKDIDGLLFISTGQNKSVLENHAEIPIVVVDRQMGDTLSTVYADNFGGGFQATNFLLEKQQYPIHFLSGPLTINTYFERQRGYLFALESAGYEKDEALIHYCKEDIKSGYATIKQILEDGQVPASIFAANDILALGAMKALLEKGLTIGKDVMLVGYDDIETAAMVTPALTTVSQPKYEMGKQAAELLLAQIKGEINKVQKVVLAPKLVVRDTAK